jgi:CRISPR-associated protein Csx10
MLEEKLEIENVMLETADVQFEVTSGYNHKWKARIPEVTAAAAGSILVYEYDGDLEEDKLLEFEEKGVGERKNEGFGRIIISPELSFSKCKNYQEKPRKKLDDYHLVGESKKTLQTLVACIAKNRIDREINMLAVNTKMQLKSKLTKAQTGRLLDVIRKAKFQDEQDAKQTIATFKQGLKSKSKEQYELSKIFKKHSLYELLDLLVDDKCSISDITGSGLSYRKFCIGNVMSKEESSYNFKIKLSYVEKLLHSQ